MKHLPDLDKSGQKRTKISMAVFKIKCFIFQKFYFYLFYFLIFLIFTHLLKGRHKKIQIFYGQADLKEGRGGHGRLGAHQKLGPLLSILEPPMGIKSPCLDVSQDRATKRPAPRHTNAFYWTEKYMLERREIHVHGVPHQMQHQIRPHNALSELDAAYIFLLCNSCHNRQRDCL